MVTERLKKLEEIKKLGIDPFPSNFSNVISSQQAFKKAQNKGVREVNEIKKSFQNTIFLAGRMMTFRTHGKLAFAQLQDFQGRIQIAFIKDLTTVVGLNEESLSSYKFIEKLLDLGDLLGLEGELFKTNHGEITLLVKNLTLLTKSLRSLPEKFHGLKDQELRYRKRYLDLIMNQEVKNRFLIRTKVINLVREFLNKDNFVEVETPVLQVLYGGTNAKPFTTKINAYNLPMYLRVAPELYLKRLVVGGFEKVYEIARNFRNEGVDQTHNPEFTMIEWYEAYVDYQKVMDRTEELYKFIAKNLFDEEVIFIHGKKVNISQKWPRITLKDSLKQFLKIDTDTMSQSSLEKFLKENKIDIRGEKNKGKIEFAIFDKLVCPKLHDPVWIIDYPKEVSPLAKETKNQNNLTERFECYIGGKEIGDGWTEIVNPLDQKQRFENEQKNMRDGNEEAHPMDEDFIEALEYGMPPTGGIGVGIDRLVMLFTDHWSIRDILFFPTMKPKIN